MQAKTLDWMAAVARPAIIMQLMSPPALDAAQGSKPTVECPSKRGLVVDKLGL